MHLPSTEMSELLLHSFRTDFIEATQDRKQDNDTRLVQQQWLRFHSYYTLFYLEQKQWESLLSNLFPSNLFLSNLFLSMSKTAEFAFLWSRLFHFSKHMRFKTKVQLPVAEFSETLLVKRKSHPPVAEQIVYKDHWKTQRNSQYEIMLTVSRCVRWCFARSLELLKAFWQPGCWHRYGFSPVWLRRWILRFSSLENALLHPSNWKMS